ncbi:urea transporter [Photobacterium damselae]|uniref:urea transporter n=1 Tax=Photobacterium damselae TaxID=38293 RepID=UPI001EEDEF1C|nr:urea transporter [Photobacterium damselae]UKA12005.1 urea transporter [Photobacterium damselae subsp. damselae]
MLRKNISIYFKSISQVFFIENCYTGLIFLIAISYAAYLSNNVSLAIAAVLAAILSNIFAVYSQYDQVMIDSGLFGFNAVLLAMSVAIFMENSPAMWFIMIIGILLSTLITAAFKNILTDKLGIPGSTGPFVFTGWLILFAGYNSSSVTVNTGIHPEFITNFISHNNNHLNLDYINVFFKNIGQVYFLSSPISGALILLGILVASRKYAFYASLGSALSIVIANLIGLNIDIIGNGLYGFSPVLTAMALGCVFIQKNIIYGVLGIIVTVFLQASLYEITTSLSIPTFTSAYVLCMYLFVAAFNSRKKVN